MKEKTNNKKNVKRVAIDCVFRAISRSREFTTTRGNFEAFNILMNKMDKMAVAHQPGRLIFEFIPGELMEGDVFLKRGEIDSEMCICGHHWLAHGQLRDREKSCQVQVMKKCACKKYKRRKNPY